MTVATQLTFAELEYLLARSQTWPTSRAMLGIAAATSDELVASGLASLIVRGLATHSDAGVELVENVRAASAVVDAAQTWLEIGYESTDTAFTSNYGTSADCQVRTLVSLVAPGCFEIDALAAEGDPVEQVRDLLLGLLDEVGPSAVGVRSHSAQPVSSLVLSRDAEGAWFRRRPNVEEGLGERVERGEAEAVLVELLTSALRKPARVGG